MGNYKYSARDPSTGKKIHSEIEAESESSAAKQLKAQGLTPIDVSEASGLNISNPLNRVKTKDKVLFSRQLSTLINAGLPLVQSLRNVSNQTQNKGFKVVINSVITDVEAGSAFSKALAKHPKVFDEVFVSLVAAGEVSGTLDKSLERLADQKEKDAEILSKVRGAFVYPVIVLVVMTAVVIFMTVSVLPTVEAVYTDLDVKIPFVTRIMLGFSRFIINYWPFLIGFLGISLFLTLRWSRTLTGKRVADRLKMKLWPIGRLFMKVYMARFTRVGGTLVAAGVPLLQMMGITARAVNNVHIEESITRAAEKVKGGKALSESIKNDPSFLELVPDMLKIGEDSGQIEQMLNKTADYYEKEVDNEIRTISSTIEPILMIIMGIVAITVVVAVLLPIYSLVGQDAFSF